MFTRFRRPFVANQHIDGSLGDVRVEIEKSIDKHGQGALVSPHKAPHENDLIQMYKELAQVAQVAIFGMASIIQAAQLCIDDDGV